MSRPAPNRVLGACAAALMLAACGSGSPTSPTTGNSGGATIAGTVLSGATQNASTSSVSADVRHPLAGSSATAPMTGLSVRVVGTNLSTGVGSDGRFQISGVPPGSVKLQFTGSGVDVTTTLTDVGSNQFVEIQVQISGTSAVIVADSREGKVTMCHAEGNGSYHAISVSESAEAAHRAHGDGKIGDLVPGQSALRFDENCRAAGAAVDTADNTGVKVTLCHRTGSGRYNMITVDKNAEPAHRAHGDGKVGEAVPDMAGKTFGGGCSVL